MTERMGRRQAEPYGGDIDSRWDHIIGPEIARADEAHRRLQPARHRLTTPAQSYYDMARTLSGPDTSFMRHVDAADARRNNSR